MMSFINFVLLIMIFVMMRKGFEQIAQQLRVLGRRRSVGTSVQESQVTKSAPVEHAETPAPPKKKDEVVHLEESAKEDDAFLTELLTQDKKSSVDHVATQRRAEAQTPDALVVFKRWFVHEWPMKVGALLVLAAVGWAVTYAFTNDIIGPVGRVTLALIFGGGLVVFGAQRIRISATQGSVLLFVGLITMLMAMLAGIDYRLFPAALALFAMLLVVAFVSEVGRTQNHKALVLASFVFAALLPLLMYASLTLNMIFLYLFVLSLGTIVTVVRSVWRDLLTLNVFVVLFYSVVLGGMYGFDETLLNMLFMIAFSALFYCANLGIVLVARRASGYDTVTAVLVGLAFYTWTMMIVPETAQAIFLSLGALVFVYGVYMLHAVAQTFGMVVAYAGVAIGLLLAATALIFDGTALTVLFIVEISALIIAGVWIAHVQRGTQRTSVQKFLYHGAFVAYFVPIVLSLQSVVYALSVSTFYSAWRGTFVDIDHLIVIATVAATAFTIAAIVITLPLGGRVRGHEKDVFHVSIVRIFGVCGALYTSFFVWMSAHMLFGDAVGTFVALVIYTLVGIVLYINGGREEYAPYKIFGSIFLLTVVARLFLVDFWAMVMSAKVITFFVVGVLFISTAFLARHKSD